MRERMFRGRVRRVHFIGIGGSGMNGIAEVLLHLGFEVHGSDQKQGPATQRLEKLGATIHIGHAAAHIEGADVIVKSTAVPRSNPEVRAADERGIPVIPRAEMLAELMRLYHGVAVAGSHGKTTTTSLIASILGGAGLDPTVVIGGKLNQLDANAWLGQGDYMVAEADESDGSFLFLAPTLAVVTNLDLEHVDYWTGGLEELSDAFVTFLNRLPFYGLAVVCIDAPHVQALLPRVSRRVVTYGKSRQAEFQVGALRHEGGKTVFDLSVRGAPPEQITLNLLGTHNALNAAAAIAIADELGVSIGDAKKALSEFGGVDRRLTTKGEAKGVLVLDDYGHHPTEVKATLSAVRNAYPRRKLWVLFEPHRYSRTEAFLDDFGRAFNDADSVCLAPVYAAGEAPIAGADAAGIVASMRHQGHKSADAYPSLDAAIERIGNQAQPGDVVVTMGAGTVTKAGPAVLAAIARRPDVDAS